MSFFFFSLFSSLMSCDFGGDSFTEEKYGEDELDVPIDNDSNGLIDEEDSWCASGETDFTCHLDLGGGQGIDFVNIPAGTFLMGKVEGGFNEDQHQVTLTRDFLVSTTEITQGMYFQVMGYQAYSGYSADNGTDIDYPTYYGSGVDYPAYYVSWHMAADFSNKLTQQHNTLNGTSLQECYTCSGSGATSVSCTTAIQPIYECTGYRMLTEAEWEYAARAGTTQAFWTSNGGGDLPSEYDENTTILTDGFDLSTYAWYSANNSPNTSNSGSKEVATKIPNDYGLYDMAGNLWEWTHDSYTASLGTGATTDPVREIDSDRVYRGGSWEDGPHNLRSSRRLPSLPSNRFSDTLSTGFGFRTGRSNP